MHVKCANNSNCPRAVSTSNRTSVFIKKRRKKKRKRRENFYLITGCKKHRMDCVFGSVEASVGAIDVWVGLFASRSSSSEHVFVYVIYKWDNDKWEKTKAL